MKTDHVRISLMNLATRPDWASEPIAITFSDLMMLT